MSLISLLLALSLERARRIGADWWWQHAFHWWLKRFDSASAFWQITMAVLLPSLLMVYLQLSLSGWLFGLPSLALWIFVPLITLGCPPLQQGYRDYLRSAAEGNEQACSEFNQQLLEQIHPLHQVDPEESIAISTGTQLMWLNYRYYFAVIFFYVLAGPAGALFYACSRGLYLHKSIEVQALSPSINTFMHYLDWLPSRLASLCYLAVGNTNQAITVWLPSLKDRQHSNGYWLTKVAVAAELSEQEHDSEMLCVATTCRFVSLAKRGIMLAIAIIAALTIAGWLI
ncbi:regulatory signaling modulator protein AmpE [Agarivorans sp. TSD2052]|uniref:regulatory signaling modulator protein AmpE n=1 Tax=Agarivorans sp. TSD2052 TaxID=2937286 RepID=UPI00200F145D|nr:regulatory signaling modulator protein AmpE [Agarivorans sp. TSD2052]UPW17925.1 regulatory signaling modulator protein AmpE [Agarivorans sp. TSD2052]